jgi:hypothetical protein
MLLFRAKYAVARKFDTPRSFVWRVFWRNCRNQNPALTKKASERRLLWLLKRYVCAKHWSLMQAASVSMESEL